MPKSLNDIATELLTVTSHGQSPSADALLVGVALVHGAEMIAQAVRCVSHGDEQSPRGLEALAIALAGAGLRRSVGEQIERLTVALEQTVKP